MPIQSILKKLPSVEKVLEDTEVKRITTPASRSGITRIVRECIDAYRSEILAGSAAAGDQGEMLRRIVSRVFDAVTEVAGGRQQRVINATGVILHTNLGRAVLGEGARKALELAASGYVDLEMDMRTGERIHRDRRAARLLALLTGAEDALVVNNTAAAVLLAVDTFASQGAVAVSRGELVEIGGSFRLPEILRKAAANVLEIGTTNRTHIKDYIKALDDGATLILKVHTSNYRIVGYTNEVSLGDLASLGRERGVPVMYDQGSGVLFPFEEEGIEGEESIGSVMQSGVDIVAFSGDKVLGGPQAGILLGRSGHVGRMRNNHLSRALRVDKLTLGSLEAVLSDYWTGSAASIPVLGMIKASAEEIGRRARLFADLLQRESRGNAGIGLVDGESSIGGGSFPINPLRTVLVEINLSSGGAPKAAALLRALDPPVMVRVKGDSLYIDLRTVDRSEEKQLRKNLSKMINDISGRE